ncbi:MAG: ABC transporter ATP-binding protein [Lewinellaceae bacterium]|nr:ABC transporter ATP-binding protein [Phaeodactylibacter sp.]MCB9041235.1 ABC transporter ATP-binding protein [Lewinellaceae bacterium]
MKVIETINLSKTYNPGTVPVHALNGVDLEIKRGEFTAIVGPSGSGKTTLLNIIGGLDNATSGSVIIEGTDIAKLKGSGLISFRLHNIGFVFQAYNLIPVLTAKENVEFVMLLQNRPKAEREARVMNLLEAVGLRDKTDKRPSELSGGQQQRVAVARALASKPQFVLADEPTANLDGKSAENLLDIMLRLNEEENMTFIFSTHDARVIRRARRVVTLEDGRVVKDEGMVKTIFGKKKAEGN